MEYTTPRWMRGGDVEKWAQMTRLTLFGLGEFSFLYAMYILPNIRTSRHRDG